MQIFGFFVLAIVIGIIILLIAAGIEIGLRAADDERVEILAEKRFREMWDTAEIRVHQRFVIVDEMK